MTGAGLPPIAIEAVLKLLAVGQEAAKARKAAVRAEHQPKLRLDLTPPSALADPAMLGGMPRNVKRPQRRPASRPGMRTPPSREDCQPESQGAKSC